MSSKIHFLAWDDLPDSMTLSGLHSYLGPNATVQAATFQVLCTGSLIVASVADIGKGDVWIGHSDNFRICCGKYPFWSYHRLTDPSVANDIRLESSSQSSSAGLQSIRR